MRGYMVAMISVFVTFSSSIAAAETLALWTFEGNPATLLNSYTINGIKPELGTYRAGSEMSGLHRSTNTDYTLELGNGSPSSYKVNTWAPDDYHQFRSISTGYQNIVVSWDMRSNGTSADEFKLAYSTDGINFTDSISLLLTGTPWNVVTRETLITHYTVNLAALADASAIYLRLVSTEAVWGDSSKYIQMDNFMITGDAIAVTTIPVTPIPIAAAGGGGLLALLGLGRGGRGRV